MNKMFEKWRRSESGKYRHLESESTSELCDSCSESHSLNNEVDRTILDECPIIPVEDIKHYAKTR